MIEVILKLRNIIYMWYLQNVPGIILILRNRKQHNHLSHISFKINPFCQRLYRCWKHSWKPFCESLLGLSVPFLMMSVASQERRHFNADFN